MPELTALVHMPHSLGRSRVGQRGSDRTEAVPIQQQATEHDHDGNQLAASIVSVDVPISGRRHGRRCPVHGRDVLPQASGAVGHVHVLGPAFVGAAAEREVWDESRDTTTLHNYQV